MPLPAFEAFTVKYGGAASQIVTPVQVMQAFDPAAPPAQLPLLHQTHALWDTGASKSVVAPSVVQALGLTPVGKTLVAHAGGQSSSPTYLVNFKLPNNVGVAGVVVSEFPGTAGGFQCIVGMDIITLGDLSISNLNGETWVSFRVPSRHQIDFVADHSRQLKASVGRNDPCPCGATTREGRPLKFKNCHGR